MITVKFIHEHRGWVAVSSEIPGLSGFDAENPDAAVAELRYHVRQVKRWRGKRPPRQGCIPAEHTHNGRTQTLQQWADEIGVSKSCLKNRMAAGDTLEQALRPRESCRRTPKLYTAFGKSLSVRDWAAVAKVDTRTMYERLKHMHIAAAVTAQSGEKYA